MQLVTHIIQLVDVLAWPTVVLIIFFSARKPLTELLPRIQRLKYKDAELEFEKMASVLRQELPLQEETSEQVFEIEERLKAIARSSPRLSIIEAWSQVEFSLGKYAAMRRHITEGEKIHAHISFHEVAKEVFGDNDELLRRYHDLRKLRNKAVHEHGFEPSPDNAHAFAVLASRLIATIDEKSKP